MQEELNRKLLWLTSIRMLVVASILLIGFLSDPAAVLTGEKGDVFTPTIGLISIQSLIYIGLLRGLRRWPRVHAYIQLFGDLIFVTLLIYGFEAAAQFSTLYIFVIAIASLYLDRTGVLVVAGAAFTLYTSLAFHWLDWLLDPGRARPAVPAELGSLLWLAYNLLIHLVGFYGVAILTAYLARGVERAKERLRTTHLDLAYLQSLYGDVIQSMSGGVMTTDLDGIVASVNQSGREILGRSEGSLVGSHITESGMFTEEQWRQHTRGSERVRVEIECRRGDAQLINLGVTLSELRDGEGTWHGYTLIFRDLTELRQLEEQLRTRDRMAAIGQLAAGLAHEVGNPLTAISGSVEMLAKSLQGGAPERRLLEIILKESRRLDRTVKNFLRFARPGPRRLSEVDVAALLREDVELLRNSDDVGPAHAIVADLQPPSVFIQADRDHLGQVFWNLARNALQAMPGGGTLTVHGRLSGDRYRFQFRDTGEGMTEEERDKLFQPFKSFFSSGTGLGMAIVYRIVAEHRGEIRADSQPGHGTVITIELPVRAPEAAHQEEVGREAAIAGH